MEQQIFRRVARERELGEDDDVGSELRLRAARGGDHALGVALHVAHQKVELRQGETECGRTRFRWRLALSSLGLFRRLAPAPSAAPFFAAALAGAALLRAALCRGLTQPCPSTGPFAWTVALGRGLRLVRAPPRAVCGGFVIEAQHHRARGLRRLGDRSSSTAARPSRGGLVIEASGSALRTLRELGFGSGGIARLRLLRPCGERQHPPSPWRDGPSAAPPSRTPAPQETSRYARRLHPARGICQRPCPCRPRRSRRHGPCACPEAQSRPRCTATTGLVT